MSTDAVSSDKPTPRIEVAFGTLEQSGVTFSVLVSKRVGSEDLRALAELLNGAADKIDHDPSLIDQWVRQ